jgi:hypothetical protein
MALARVVSFEDVDPGQMAANAAEIRDGEPPEGLEASELIILHDPDGKQALAIVLFDDEDAYRRGDAILDAMPAEGTPGRRASVTKYELAVRMTPR